MGGLFSLDSKIMIFLGRITDLIILNILFLVTCIPIVTIGAAWTSLYEITLKMAKDEEAYMIKGYLSAFKSNFKKSTPMWLVIGIMYIILFADFWICIQSEGVMWDVLLAFAIVFFIGLTGVVSYVFPLQAKFVNTFKNTFINAWFMSIKHFPTTISIIFMNSFILLCAIYNSYTLYYGVLAYGLLGFATVAYINSILLVRVFEKYYGNDSENAETEIEAEVE